MSRRAVVVTSPRVRPGQLSWPAWEQLRAGPVLTADAEHPQLAALRAAGVAVQVVAEPPADADLVWLAGPGVDPVAERLLAQGAQLVVGAEDLPGARLLDVVATMDRLRSPGGCPWDREQTHTSLAPYLIEEAYEALDAVETGDEAALREELGDVLLQVAFHARLGEELPAPRRWSIDDVAAALVDKLVRRHPHVFGDRVVADAAEVQANWDVIKAAEKGRTSPADGVPLGQPALRLAAALQRKATRAGLAPEEVVPELGSGPTPAHAVAAAAAEAEEAGGVDAVGELLWLVVALARSQDVDPEAALRGRARRFRDQLGGRG